MQMYIFIPESLMGIKHNELKGYEKFETKALVNTYYNIVNDIKDYMYFTDKTRQQKTKERYLQEVNETMKVLNLIYQALDGRTADLMDNDLIELKYNSNKAYNDFMKVYKQEIKKPIEAIN